MTFTRRSAAARGAVALITLALGACAQAPKAPSYPPVPGVSEVDLQWQPKEGMRLVHRIATDVTASGPLTKPIPDKDKKQRFALTRTTDVAAVAGDSFELRFAQDGVPLPATLRFSRRWTPLGVKLDDGTAVGEKDRAALDSAVQHLAEPFTQAAQFFRRWKIGDTQPFDISLSAVPGASGGGRGSMTFRRVVVIDGREAAEFDWRGDTEFVFSGDPGRGTPGRMTIAGHEWRDLATGALLRLTAKGVAEFTRQGQPTRVEYQTDEVLDAAASRL